MDGHSHYGGGSCPNWLKIGSTSSDVTSTATSQQQRFYYPMSLNSVTKNKSNKISGDGGVGYQDYQNRYPHQQEQQYPGTDPNGASYYPYTGFHAKQQLQQQSTILVGGKRLRIGGGTFPKKSHVCYGIDAAYLPPNKRSRNYSTTGKTAAMIINELYPEFKDQCTYKTIMVNKLPRFECSFTVQAKTFSAEGSNKKAAKQLACELALKELRPDIMLDISVSISEAKKMTNCDFCASQTNGSENSIYK
ncbi:unnamed protein product [Onchocerca flexuosa]|uniref:DRBM domain-containing protein n=1 Tax=Onchocerca flexuosa TaxID=387005 RepID=A0A183HBU2_9BILA|nr:unnamed protein product [Onchocerca flexuosa]